MTMRINIVSIFPGFFEGPLGLSIPARAAVSGLVEYQLIDPCVTTRMTVIAR